MCFRLSGRPPVVGCRPERGRERERFEPIGSRAFRQSRRDGAPATGAYRQRSCAVADSLFALRAGAFSGVSCVSCVKAWRCARRTIVCCFRLSIGYCTDGYSRVRSIVRTDGTHDAPGLRVRSRNALFSSPVALEVAFDAGSIFVFECRSTTLCCFRLSIGCCTDGYSLVRSVRRNARCRDACVPVAGKHDVATLLRGLECVARNALSSSPIALAWFDMAEVA